MSKNLSELSGRKGLKTNLFEEVGKLAAVNGTVEASDISQLANAFLFGEANLLGTTSFYDFSRPENKGKKVYVCNGSACLTAGTQDKVRESLEGHFHGNEIGNMTCLGRCHEHSAFHFQGKNYSGDAINQLSTLLSGSPLPEDRYEVQAAGSVLLTGPRINLDQAAHLLRDALSKGPDALLAELKASGLRGRGGAGFPIAFKLDSCRNAPGNPKFIVCNADEGDPGAYSDRYLLEKQPELVLLGMLIAGLITGATAGVLYIRAEYPESHREIAATIEAFQKANLCGSQILGTAFHFEFKMIQALGAYICGEETALLSSIEGQRPEVRVRPPYPTQNGLFNRPTVVNNVETLACIPWITQNGGEAYATIGNGRSTGTKLVCLDGFFNKPGIYEVDMGTPLAFVVETLGGGFKVPVKALHIGGPLGGIVPVNKVGDLTLDFESFSAQGFLLGHASILCIPETFPMVHYLEHLFEFTAHESCGKCFPCRIGSTRGTELLQGAQKGRKIDRELFQDLLETLETGSLCALGGGLPLPVKNALQYFPSELDSFFA